MKWRVKARRALFDRNMMLWRAYRADGKMITAFTLESLMGFIERYERGLLVTPWFAP